MRILHLDSGREMRGGQWQALRLHRGLIQPATNRFCWREKVRRSSKRLGKPAFFVPFAWVYFHVNSIWFMRTTPAATHSPPSFPACLLLYLAG